MKETDVKLAEKINSFLTILKIKILNAGRQEKMMKEASWKLECMFKYL